MPNLIFNSVLVQNQPTINPLMVLLSLATSLILGLILAATYKYKTLYTKEFVITLTLLPALIALIIFLVNGNLGTSVAVAGTFSLIRFRSAAGGAKEILSIFLATAIGIATGMGLLFLAVVVTVVLCLILLIFENSEFTTVSQTRRQVVLVVPQTLDYEYILDGIVANCCKQTELLSVKTIQRKKVIELTYLIDLLPTVSDKHLLDALFSYREDMDITISRAATKKKAL